MVWRIPNMFDPGISTELSGTQIDTPMILASELQERFGALQCYLEAAPTVGPNTYKFHTTKDAIPLPSFLGPHATHRISEP